MKINACEAHSLSKLSGYLERTEPLDWSFFREEDFYGLNVIDTTYHPETVYYPGPFLDLAPALVLGKKFYYHDKHLITEPIKTTLKFLQDMNIIKGLKEVTHINKDFSYPEFQFSAYDAPKSLSVFENSDVELDGVIPQITEADLIYGYNSLVTEEMLQKAKSKCLILDHPGAGAGHETADLGLKDYTINEEQIKRHNLIQVVFPNSDKSIFRYSKLYEKR